MKESRFRLLIGTWCDVEDSARVVIVTDSERYPMALEIQRDIPNDCRIIRYIEAAPVFSARTILKKF